MAARRPNHPHTTPSFAELGLSAELIAPLAEAGITAPFPIQTATMPDALAGRDLLGRGRTGSGKTYAFVLPLLQRLARDGKPRRSGRPRALILAPTRELATQIEAAIAPLAGALSLRVVTIFGGVGAGPQIAALRRGVDIVVACPGRLEDHVRSGHARLDAIEVTVLDEADHLADLGFIPVVKRLLDQTPRSGQRLLFSATLDAAVDGLVRRYLTNPVTHSVDSALSPVARMAHHVLHVRHEERLEVLADLAAAPGRSLVFTRTKRGAKALTRRLVARGVPAVELHGDLAQGARTRNLTAFADGTAKALVATDIAARGIHVDDVALVIHADPPVEHKAYLHRSGRTARAGAAGTVVTLMSDSQVADVRNLTRQAGIKPKTTRLGPGDPFLAELAPGERTFVAPPPETGSRAAPRPETGSRAVPRQRSGFRGHTSTRDMTRSQGEHVTQPSGRTRGGRAATPTPAGKSSAAAFSSRTRLGGRHAGR